MIQCNHRVFYMSRISVSPSVLQWARQRAGLEAEEVAKKFPQIADWELGKVHPTITQLENFAKATHVPLGFLFLPEPPEFQIPLADFRTLESSRTKEFSPDLIDTIHAMKRRQKWLRDDRLESEAEPLPFVGSATLRDNPIEIGNEMRRIVGLNDGWTRKVSTWTDAVSELRSSIESLGVMAVINGIVGNNTRRKLNVKEFRGFALSDPYAPLIFVNGSDAKSAQMFTLAHELAHLWLGEVGEGLSGFKGLQPDGDKVETFCNKAAAEFLVPAKEMMSAWTKVAHSDTPFEILAGHFKVSPVVVGRRAMDLNLVDPEEFFSFYNGYIQQEQNKKRRGSGGDFYNTQNTRVGLLFITQIARAAKEGRIGFKQAYDLSGLNSGTFQEYASRSGVTFP